MKMFNSNQTNIIRPLSNLAEGESGKVEEIHGGTLLQRYFLENGILMGRRITVVKTAAEGQGMIIMVDGRTMTLGQLMTGNIRVKGEKAAGKYPVFNPTRELVKVYSYHNRD
jgi:Fe2+ transport system protein FeoA